MNLNRKIFIIDICWYLDNEHNSKYLLYTVVWSTLIGPGILGSALIGPEMLLRQLSYAIKNQLVASKALYWFFMA